MRRLLAAVLTPVFLLLFLLWPAPAFAAPSLPSAPFTCAPRIVSIMAAQASTPERPTDGWEAVTLPDNWSHRWPTYDGTVWYRVDWERGCSSIAADPVAPDGMTVALSIDSISLAGEVFINDELLWRDLQLVEPLSRSWNLQRYWLLPESALDAERNTVWVRVQGLAAQTPGLGILQFGSPQAIKTQTDTHRWRSRTLFMLNLTISAVLGCIAFFVWLSGRTQSVFGWYTLVSMCWMLFGANTLATEGWPFPSSFAVARANNLAYVAFISCFCMFTWRLTEQRPPPWVEKGLWLLAAVTAGVMLLTPDWTSLHLAVQPFTLIYFSNAMVVAWRSLRTRQFEHQVIAACLLLMCVIGIRDILVLTEVLHSRVFYSAYTCLLYLLLAAVLLMARMERNTRGIENFNQQLKETVAQACAELSTTLEHEHALALANERLHERLQLARDLHDGLGGQIVRSIMLVEQTDGPMERPHLLSILKLLRDDLRQVVDSGASASAVRPESPAEWAAALRYRFANLFDELAIDSQWHLPPAWRTLPSALECMRLARVVEEALTNVVKHSRARQVSITLEFPDDSHLSLRIEDDGIGFDVGLVQRTGLGIGMASMRARMERMGGTLAIHSHLGTTVLEAMLPLVAATDQARGERDSDVHQPN